ncbi:hypothetical protein ES706_02381 [subsurface metagenome]
MLVRDCIFYISHRCPICARVKWALRRLEIEGLLHVITVDVGINRKNSLADFYDYLRNQWGGERRVPVLKIGREVYLVPRFYTIVGETPKIEDMEEIDKQVLALEQMIRENLKRIEPESAPFLTHKLMRLRL